MQTFFNRREAIAALAAAFHARGWAGPALCPGDPAISNVNAPLTIDTHAHVFNGTDLQVKKFLSETLIKEGSELHGIVEAAGALLQGLAWNLAPDFAREKKALARYAAQLSDCAGPEQAKRVALASFEEGYRIGQAELKRAARVELPKSARGTALLGIAPDANRFQDLIDALPTTYRKFEEDAATPGTLANNPTLMGYVRFVLHNFNHRHVNAIDYLTTYGKDSPRKVDLLVASMVDFDWWLAGGARTKTTLEQQVDLMGDISVLMGGRVHGFVPFCPFREAATRDASGMGQSMRLVKRAIETKGFIGVKLYPPMGFAAWGNTGKTIWKGKGLPPPSSEADFGARLDRSMRTLFEYCMAKDVPVMAHSNHSNGPSDEFMDLAGSQYWKAALDEFKGLRVSFGHFGDSDLEQHDGDKTTPFLDLMTAAPGSPGVNTFADSGYFAGAMSFPDQMQAVLQELYDKPGRIMIERLMYGTDWLMTLPQADVERYLSAFIQVISAITAKEPGIRARGTSLADAFFGVNAVEFLGLRKRPGTRQRLEDFYAVNKVPTPDWMAKVDKL